MGSPLNLSVAMDPAKDLIIEAFKFVGTSATVATLAYMWIRSLQDRLQKTLEELRECKKLRHEEKDEMIEEMERDVAMMEKMYENSKQSDRMS